MRFSYAFCNELGDRSDNEDSIFINKRLGLNVFIVADGLGGQGNGKKASLLSAETIGKLLLQQQTLERDDIRKIFQNASEEIIKLQTPTQQMMASLGLVVRVHNRLAIVHVGDTRVYHFHKNKIVHQTKDHSVSQMAVYAGEIQQQEIRFHADRNKLLCAIGSKNSAPEQHDIPRTSLDDKFLICSDGFWECIEEEKMEMLLQASSTPQQWMQQMQTHIATHPKSKKDNFSAISIFRC